MMPHDEGWELVSENGHPNTHILLENFYWDCTDENTPLGNDTGADILAFYSKEVSKNPNLEPVQFLESVLRSWEMLIDNWTLTDPTEIRGQLSKDPYAIPTSDYAVIGLAFAMFVIHGHVDLQIRDMAIIAIQREKLDVLTAKWRSAEKRCSRLDNFMEKLYSMQIAG